MNRAAKAPRRAEGNRSFLRPKTSLCGPEAPFRFVLNRLPGRLPGRLPSIRRCFAPDFFLHPVPYASVRPDSARFDRAWFACLRSVCGLFRSPCSSCSVRSSGFGPLRSCLVCLLEVRLRLVLCVPSPLSRPVSFALPCLALVRFFSPVRSSCKKASKKLESRKNSIYL